jgi:hypothetical protein
MIRLEIIRQLLNFVPVAVAFTVLGGPAAALAQGAWGEFHDRADRDGALRRLSPQQERDIKVWALQNPEAARRLQGAARDPQSAILEQYEKLSPEELESLGNEAEMEVR